MAKSLELAMGIATGTATPVADADEDSATATSTTGLAGDLDAVVEKVKKQSKADIVKPKETLADYVCSDSLKEELLEVKNFFENASVYKSAGIRIPKGILFKGVPGTGKTYAARCIAGDVDCYFMTCTASSLQGMYIGSGAENIRNVFEGAKALRKASGKGVIIFFDELDSLGSRVSHSGSASGEEDRTLNQLLAELSGFEDVEGIMVLGATNYPERIDDALMRSGRFSRQITIEIPCRKKYVKIK
jgi:cell division protease FtsH